MKLSLFFIVIADNFSYSSPEVIHRVENITGKKVTSIAFPFGDYNEYSVKAAKNAGYNIAFTTNKGFADRDDNPLELDRIYVSSYYDMNTFISILEQNVPFCLAWNKMFCYNKNRNKMFRRVREKEIKSMSFFCFDVM